ncbi:hypothetical protein [Dictyobacter aurantiacus]|nr:hypothetical protein [Dictyobacter aurantiacus]
MLILLVRLSAPARASAGADALILGGVTGARMRAPVTSAHESNQCSKSYY